MLDQEEDLENEEELAQPKHLSRKKMLIFLLPVLIVIGLSVGLYYAFNRDYHSSPSAYSIVKRDGADDAESITVFYDLPKFSAPLSKDGADKKILHLGLNIELSDVESIKTIEILMPKINDVILTHIIELTTEDISGSKGLHWLKEELLYRLKLVAAPIKINNLNIKSLDIETISN